MEHRYRHVPRFAGQSRSLSMSMVLEGVKLPVFERDTRRRELKYTHVTGEELIAEKDIQEQREMVEVNEGGLYPNPVASFQLRVPQTPITVVT